MSIQESFSNENAGPREPIPGYRLLEHLGRGGYGEVWKTLAPGGVPKAIKLIYGGDPSRMATELRALNRIKDVRHPFLLSIERIEQNGELLAIVTELGDKNLQQHFQDCQSNGLAGIPQNDLMSMMRDVADVLDYIYQEYALQHLDIKPANLLLFGRRLKVADFGLVKNIYERSASMVHGLTPTYAAPEIFDGQPTGTSDQYSLAILYQEMLTGALPFNGTTAARLATQHLREKPDLAALPAAQQPIIARALSKDPQRRFASSMEMVEELAAAARRAPAVSSAPAGAARGDSGPARDSATRQPIASSPVTASRVPTVPSGLRDTNPPSPNTPTDRLTPTIVIGIGGSAGKTLQRLRLRIADRLGGVKTLPAFKFLFLDGDHDSLSDVNHDQQAWTELETVHAPLRSSTEYREQGQVHRRWLSRRWLYNVPRNLSTDGFRPLGRLALMTNANRILASLRSAIAHVTAACPGITPRILFLASISGGTGSGMLADLAYAARHELQNAGFPDATVDAMLLHSTPVGTERDKASLNAIATLIELDHYSAPGSFYPGEPLLQTPPFHGNNRTFRSAQFLHLGEDVDASSWLRAIDNVAELLYCRLLTNLDHVLCDSPSAPSDELPSVDLVQVQQIGGYSGDFVDDLTRQLCVDMIDGWCGSEPESGSGDRHASSAAAQLLNSMEYGQNAKNQRLTAEAETKLLACGVDVELMMQRALEMLQQELNVPQRDFLQAQFDEAVKAVDDVPDHEISRLVVAMQDQAIGLDFGERPKDSKRITLVDLLYSRLASQAMPIASRYIAWVSDLIDHPTGGVDAARLAAEAGRDCIRDLISVLAKTTRERHTQQTSSRILLTSPPGPEEAAKSGRGWLGRRAKPLHGLAEKLIQHGLCSFEELIDVLVQLQLRSIEANLSAMIDQLLTMWQELNQFGKRLRKESNAANSDSGLPSRYERSLRKWLLDHRSQLVHQLRTRVEHDVLAGPKKLQRFLQQRSSMEETLGGPLRKHARRVVLNSMDQLLCTVLQHVSQGAESHELEIYSALTEILREPWSIPGGYEERSVVVVPAGTGKTMLHNRKSPELPQVPIVSARTNNVAICRERRHASIQGVIHAISHGQSSVIAVAANLHARIDVEWRSATAMNESDSAGDESPSTWAEVSHTVPLG